MTENTIELPSEFADLQDLAEKFATSDDLRRAATESAASTAEKHALVAELSPRLTAINAYLDEHDDEPAHLLGRLAEAACEVALEVGWPERSGRS